MSARPTKSTPPLWPRLAIYRFGKSQEPVLILGLVGDEYVILDRAGDTKQVPLFRVRLAERETRDLWELTA